MTKAHMKRLPAPKTWRIGKKEEKYVMRPYPGAHSLEFSMSLNTVLTYLGLANTKKEVKHLLQNEQVLVDEKVQHEEKLPVGFMDVVSVPDADANYRITMTNKGLAGLKISDEEASKKPVKITGKTVMKGGKVQLHTMDGRNITLDEDDYSVGDTLVIGVPSQEVEEHYPLEEGATILLSRGRHAGEIGTVQGAEGKKIVFTTEDEEYETRREYAFVIGKDEPAVKVKPDE